VTYGPADNWSSSAAKDMAKTVTNHQRDWKIGTGLSLVRRGLYFARQSDESLFFL